MALPSRKRKQKGIGIAGNRSNFEESYKTELGEKDIKNGMAHLLKPEIDDRGECPIVVLNYREGIREDLEIRM